MCLMHLIPAAFSLLMSLCFNVQIQQLYAIMGQLKCHMLSVESVFSQNFQIFNYFQNFVFFV